MFDKDLGLKGVIRYCLPERGSCRKYVCVIETNGKKSRFAVANLTYGMPNEFWMAGAIPKERFNSGLGVCACVAVINEFFKEFPDSKIISGEFLLNQRSHRLTSALGFQTYYQDDMHSEGYLTKELFDNELVQWIKKRYQIE